MATVHPGPGEDISTVAQTLLGLAGDPRDVAFVPEDGAFEVPDELADKYLKHNAPAAEEAPEPPRKRTARKAQPRRTEEE